MSWKSYRLNEDCVTFVGNLTGDTYITHDLKELGAALYHERKD